MIKKKSYIVLIFIVFVLLSCKKTFVNEISKMLPTFDSAKISTTDTLKVGIIYGSTSYFYYDDEILGYDYEMALHLAHFLNLKMKIHETASEEELIKMLINKEIDIAAHSFFKTKELKSIFSFVFPQPESHLVLVQNIGIRTISDATELNGKTVYIKPKTIYQKRLEALNKEIGGEITLNLAHDTASIEDLLEMVAEKKIEFTVANHRTAMLHKNHFKRLDCRMALSFKQKIGWIINIKNTVLQNKIETWLRKPETKKFEENIFVKYWGKSPYFAAKKVKIPKGAISPYDEYFKKYASNINWDWRMLAAVCFHESGFDNEQVSWAGAAGVMQLMPRTAAVFGLDEKTILDPEKNIEAGVQYIKSLNLSFRKVTDKEERIKFILAAYNSGPAHILDAMALAEKHGKNPYIWFDNVDLFLLKKNDPEFYNDPVVKYGRFRGKETYAYVTNTLETYYKFLSKH
ncbi:MAG: transglycosylase SLT domain-containing protein [Paludibacter sp.]|nr:transglycosylase SLT domain-containing protein [Paludibacter sp.]